MTYFLLFLKRLIIIFQWEGEKMKPHVMRKSAFIADKGVTSHNDAGVYVVRDGNKYQFGVEIDVDTVAFVNETTNKDEIKRIMDDILYEIGDIRDQFDQCFPD